MLKTGQQHLESLRDGRVLYIGSERVTDVTTHPAFRNAARSIARIYDYKAEAQNSASMSFEEGGERYSVYFQRARSAADLAVRSSAYRRIAELSYGMLGRSPDHVASFVTGMTTRPEVFGRFADNLLAYYDHMRRNDVYAAYAVVAPQAARNPEYYVKKARSVPTLRVVREDADGVVISGLKMLATGAAFANEIWIGNLIPLAPEAKKEAITCAVPCNAPGLSLWSRKTFERTADCAFDAPLTWHFDESDCMVMCEEVKVPWERVFVHDDALLSRNIYIDTPAHCYGNHQSNVRYAVKMQLIIGLASKIAQATGAIEVPSVKETLGRLAAQEAALNAMIAGQIHDAESWPAGHVTYNRRYMYAALNWCTENYSGIVDCLRELCGGGIFQLPANVSVVTDPALKQSFETYWDSPQISAVERMKLFRLAWDIVGSEFAGRHQQYEKFYAGASFIVRNHNYRETPWSVFHGYVDQLLASQTLPQGESQS